MKYHATYTLPADSAAAISAQEYNDRGRPVKLSTVVRRCLQLRTSAILHDIAGDERGKVYADGDWMLTD
jgi:hypothetical protein